MRERISVQTSLFRNMSVSVSRRWWRVVHVSRTTMRVEVMLIGGREEEGEGMADS